MIGTPGFNDLGRALLDLREEAVAAERPRRRLMVLDVLDRIVESTTAPTLFVFEDLQWADDLSLEILTELARRVPDLPVLMVAAYRTDEMPPDSTIREWRARLLTQRYAEEARVAPLTQEQTALMTTLILATGLPAPREVVDAVFERTDGVPLHVEELLGVIGDDARIDGQRIRDAVVPDTIEDAVLERFRRRSPEARSLLEAGAVLGRCFVPHVLAGIMDLPPDSLDEPLRELLDNDFLQLYEIQGVYDFRHQVIRDVLYGRISARDLRRLHARAGEFGAELVGASEIHASAHFERAGLRAQAFRAALSGARAAVRLSAHREAFQLYRRAVDNMPAELDLAEQGALFEAYSVEAASIERHEICEAAAKSARERFLAAGRPVDAARQLLWLAAVARREARPIDARRELTDVGMSELDLLPASPERDAARSMLLFERGVVQADALDLDGAMESAVASRNAARAAGDAARDIEAQALLGRVHVLRGNVESGIAGIVGAAREAQEAGFEEVGVTAYRDAATAAVRVMDYRSAATSLLEGMRYADAIEQSHCRHVMGATAALVAWADGRWDDAASMGGQELADRGCSRGAIGARTALGFVALGRGELTRARDLLSDGQEAGERSGSIDLWLPAAWGLAEADLLGDVPAAAAERCETAFARSVELGEHALLAPFVVTGVRAYLAAGRPDEAQRWLDRVALCLDGWWSGLAAAVDHGRGLLRMAAGATASAREALETAVRGWDARSRAWEAAWARLDLASCMMRTGRHADAVSLIADVVAVAERMGSQPLVARAEELSRLARGRGSAEEPWRPLTTREFEVARLIASGMTNGEIAGELTIAPKTASAHVEHSLAKLGVGRRTEIATWVTTVARSTIGRTHGPAESPTRSSTAVAARR